MKNPTKLLVGLCALTMALSAPSMAKGFEKTQEYPSTFADVPGGAWFEKEVKNAYELGFVNGKSDTFFDPDGTMTVAEGITIAARVHASYNGKEIAETKGEKWYDMYVNYALDNGIFSDGDFSDAGGYDRTVRRYEMAKLFAAAVPDDYLTAKNDIKSIPDVDENEEYADTLLKLYRAGVVLGSDDYGNFLATNPVKRSEAAAIVNRTAIPENRLSGTLTPEPERNEAYYLIDNVSMLNSTRSKTHLASSWNYEDRNSVSVNKTGDTTNQLNDVSTEGYVAINRNIETQTSGTMTLKTRVLFTGKTDGARIYLTNLAGENVFEIFTDNGVYNVKTKNTAGVGTIKPGAKDYITVVADLDTGKGYYTVNEEKAGEFDLGSFGDISKIYYSTTKEDTIQFTPDAVHMYMNYAVNENFFASKVPFDWEKSDKFVVEASKNDRYNSGVLKFTDSEKTTKKFDKLTGKTVFESYFFMPNGEDTFYISLDGATKVKVNGDKITSDGGFSHTFKNNVWQCVHIEADPASNKATIFVNGKNRGTVPMNADSFESVSFVFEKKSADGYVNLDDVKVYNIYDYADYCPVPNKVESDDYTLIMSVCSLWREGSHSGWDFASPYDESSPLMGYYDEGIPETADWETKLMVEHGIDALQYCWYSALGSGFDEPMKTPGLAWSQHDGYFYSKYSDMLKFCFMWENQNFSKSTMTFEQFKDYIWDYWVEWYFRDSRYLTIDNKPVLHIYRPDYFLSTFGADVAKQVVDFMNEDIKKYGFDGMYLLWQTDGTDASTITSLEPLGGDGIMTYAYGSSSYDPEYIRGMCDVAFSNLKTTDSRFAFVPTVATGRNIMGWENKRTPLSTIEQHRQLLEYYKNIIKERNEFDIVYFSTWNEYGEGHWLAPSGLNGFGYADEWRNAFTDASHVHDDVVPTIHQKNRISKLYNDNRSPIRAWLVEDYEAKVEEVLVWDFENGASVDGWTYTRQTKPEVIDGALHGESVEKDPIIRTPAGLGLNVGSISGIRMTVKSNVLSGSTIYFTTENDNVWNEAKKASARIDKKDEYIDLYFDLSKYKSWSGKIDCIRFDVIDAEGIYDIKKIVFEGTAGAGSVEELSVWDFGNGASVDGWTHTRQTKPEIIDGALHGESVEKDPIIRTPTGLGLDATGISGIRMTVKSNVLSGSTIFFTTENDKVWNEAKKASARIDKKDEYIDLYFDLSTNKSWAGKIDCIRFDVIDAEGIYDVKKIAFEGIVGSGNRVIVDGIELKMQPVYLDVTDNEWYVVGDPETGIFSANNFYYEWNRWNETLYLKTGTDTEFKFKVGDTAVYVNGTEKKLEKAFYTFDHMPVLPMRFILDNADIKYEASGSALKISVRGIDFAELESQRVPFQYEFNAPGDMEGWKHNNTTGTVTTEGVLSLTAKPQNSSSTGYDPGIIYSDINLPAKDYVSCEVKIRYDFLPNANENHGGTVLVGYFATSAENSLNEKKSFRTDLAKLEKDSDGFVTAVLDLTTNESWAGNVTMFRIDPTNNNGTYDIDYIRFIPGENVSAGPAAPATSTATVSGKIVNGDAEGTETTAFFSHNAAVSIEEENGNKVWYSKAKPGRNWSYLETKYTFVNGKTYKYSFDVKLTGDAEGEEAGETELFLNFRYPDSTAKDGNGSKYDHNVVRKVINVKDGWVHVEGEFTASNVETGDKEQKVAFYSVPTEKGAGYTSYSYMIDNLSVTEA